MSGLTDRQLETMYERWIALVSEAERHVESACNNYGRRNGAFGAPAQLREAIAALQSALGIAINAERAAS